MEAGNELLYSILEPQETVAEKFAICFKAYWNM